MSEYQKEDPDYYIDTDVLLRCTSQREADKYVDDVLKIATPKETDAIARAFLQVSRSETRQPRSQGRGGGSSSPVYEMLMAADTFHDFGDINIPVPKLPKGISTEDLKKKKIFISKIAAMKRLEFDEQPIDNPLYGANILNRFDISQGRDFDKLFAKQQSQIHGILGNKRPRLLPLDIWTEVDPGTDTRFRRRTQVIKLHQVAQLIGITRRFFGSSINIVIDASGNQLTTMIVSVKYITKSFFKRFTTDPNTKYIASFLEPDEWTPATIDANIFDPADNALSLPVDDRPTGDIYPDGLPFQIRLEGVTTAGGRRVHALITEGQEKHTLSLTNKETTSRFSTNYIQRAIEDSFSEEQGRLESLFRQLSRETVLAIKRGGDWGQVEHCARYKKLFVTSDKMAALYAFYRNVNFMLVQYQENLNDELDMPEFYRYTFTLGLATSS